MMGTLTSDGRWYTSQHGCSATAALMLYSAGSGFPIIPPAEPSVAIPPIECPNTPTLSKSALARAGCKPGLALQAEMVSSWSLAYIVKHSVLGQLSGATMMNPYDATVFRRVP